MQSLQSVGSFGTSKVSVNQYLVADGTMVKIENTKIKKKICPIMFKAISNLSTVTKLSIRSCRLKKLPVEVALLTNLRVLKIEDNLLTEVPPIDTLVELTELSFAYNQIKVFPNSLVKLDKITHLDFTNNPITCIPGAVSQMTSLKILHLNNTTLPYFPVSICALPDIEELTCSGNKWGVFPEQVLQFSSLKWLTLASNIIPGIHPDIGKISNITHLDLADNNLTTFPKELCTLTQLTTLLLQHNKLTQIPNEIGKMTALESLKLHDNQLAALPDTIGNLRRLVELYLQENEFTSLPSQLGDCISLRTLRLAYNKLTRVPESLAKLGKLNVLMLHDNQLTEVPKVLTQSNFLKHLLRVTLHNNIFSEGIQNDIAVMGAIHFLQEMYADTSPQTLRKQHRERSMRRNNSSRGHITRSHNRVPGLKNSTGSTGSNGSGESNDSSDDGDRPKLQKEHSLTSKLKVQARRRAISVGEAPSATAASNDSDSDSSDEFRPWKSQMEFRARSGSVPNGTAPIPPYRSFQRVYEYIVDQLDLSEKRRDSVNALPHEEKWKLLSNLSRESSLNLLVNTKPRSAPGSPTIVASPSRAGPNFSAFLTVSPSSPSLSIGSSPLKSPRPPFLGTATHRSNSFTNLRSSDNIGATRELLTNQSVAWITTFAETGGIESILQGLNSVSKKSNKNEEDYVIILEYLSCITIMIGIGLESLLISNAVEVVVQNLDSENAAVKEATVSVLDEVCNVFYSGQGLVIDALNKRSSNATEAFKPISDALADNSVPMSMKAGSMKLINNLITNTDELEARCHVRNSFLKLGLQEIIDKIRECTGDEYQRLEQQIDHFDEVMNDDGEEIALRFKQGHSDGKELLLTTLGIDKPTTRDGQQAVVRVVLPSVSHTHMSCMVAQQSCDATTTTRIMMAAIMKEYGKSMGVTDPAAYGLYVVNGSKAAPGAGETLDATGGFFLSENRYILPLAIDNVILDMRLRPWMISILVDKSVYDLVSHPTPKASGGVKPLPTVPEAQIEVEPKTTCDALLLQVVKRFFGERPCELEELAFFMQTTDKKVPDKTGKANAFGGIWLESTTKLADYGLEVTKNKLHLRKTPKMLKIILADESFEHVGYDEDTVIRSILNETFQRLVAPSMSRGNAPSPSHYGLYFSFNTDEPETGEWLDPERTLRSYYLPNRAPLRYQLKPKALNIQYHPPPKFEGVPPSFPDPVRVNFYSPIGVVLGKLGIPNLEGSGIYLLNESTGNQYLDANLSLFNQNVPENSTIIIKPASKDVQAASINIWDEPENANTIMYNVDNFQEIHAATINKLIERLTSEKDHDPEFTQVFEATYRSFMNHETLFAKLVERYIPPEHIPETPALNLVRLRVIVFLKNWIDHSGNDFPMNVMLSIEKFIDNQLCKGGHMNLAAQLKKMIQAWKIQNANEPVREVPDLNYQMSNPTKIMHGFSSLVDEWGLALQLTIRESKLFSQIMPVEFFKQKGNEVNVSHMINNFNRVAAWVPIAILSEIKLVHRANAVERFIKLAWNLRQLKNFHLLTAVLSGLSNSAVLRLKWTFAKVAKRYKQMYEELEAIMGMEGSFKVYRQTLVEASPPCVPYIGVYLTDLVFIEDGNPDKVGNMVNWTKRRYMYNIITTFQRYQLSQYDEKLPSPSSPTHAATAAARVSENKEANINTFLTFLNRMPILSDKQLYEMSMAREPRNADRRDLM